MRCAIDRLCGPAALASFGVDERNTVDLKERFGLFDEFRAAGLRLEEAPPWTGSPEPERPLASSRFFRDLDLGLPKLLPLGKP